MNQCPCKGCQERMIGCHSSCQPYIDWSSEERRLKEKEKEQNRKNRYVPTKEYYDAIRRLCKKKGR